MTPPELHYDSDATRSNINSMMQAMIPAVIILAGSALGLVLLYWAISAIRRYTS
jgi:membrane protein insertase Oxa1/YidC/SpoIIIJ